MVPKIFPQGKLSLNDRVNRLEKIVKDNSERIAELTKIMESTINVLDRLTTKDDKGCSTCNNCGKEK